MSFDRSEFAEAQAEKAEKRAPDVKRALEGYKQAAIKADLLTADPAWDHFLSLIQPQIDQAMQQRDGVWESLRSPKISDPLEVAALRNLAFCLDERISALTWVMSIPANIKKIGGVAEKKLSELSPFADVEAA